MADRVLGGRYRLEQILGRGGMATVWGARDLRLDRSVAVKILDSEESGGSIMLEQLHREARTVARLAHPNIVAIHDLDRDGDIAYLVMELVEGRSLADMLADGRLPVGQSVTFAAQVCEALSAAHAAGVIHHDVKPGNLIITPAGVVKVCDFGIARLLHVAAPAARPAIVTGTSEYMAPEQAAGDATDARTDLYALGCVLYAMLTGTPPFAGDSPIAVLHQHRYAPPRPPSAHRGDIPPDLDRLVLNLLAKDPSTRPATAEQVAARLSAMSGRSASTAVPIFTAGVAAPPTVAMPAVPRDGGPVPTRAYPVVVPPTGRLGRTRTMVMLTALALLAVAGIVAWTIGEASKPPASQPVSPASPSATPEATRPATPTGQIAAIQALLTKAVDAGYLDQDDAEDLQGELSDIARRVAKGQNRQAGERVSKLREKLDELRQDGKLSAAGYDALAPGLDQLAIALPDQGSGHGD